MTVERPAERVVEGRHRRRLSRRWTGLRPSGRTLPNGDPEPGNPIHVNCRHDGTGLCSGCLEDFRLVLADVPFLLDHLDVAIAGDVRFVERGVRRDGHGELVGSGGNAAVLAHQRLVGSLGAAGPWFDQRHPEQLAQLLYRMLDQVAGEDVMRQVAREVSAAAARAHRVIDAPPALWHYGPCPDCGRDIWQDRIHEDDTSTAVVCRFPSCGYAQPLAEHNRRQLAKGDERWLTVTELVAAFEVAGQPVTRKQLDSLIRRDGLPREARPLVRWEGGQLRKTGEVWTYKVGHVKELLERPRRNAS